MPDRRKKSNIVSWGTVHQIALALPAAEESTSYRAPAIKVRGKLFVRLREESDVIVVRIEPNDRAMRMATLGTEGCNNRWEPRGDREETQFPQRDQRNRTVARHQWQGRRLSGQVA